MDLMGRTTNRHDRICQRHRTPTLYFNWKRNDKPSPIMSVFQSRRKTATAFPKHALLLVMMAHYMSIIPRAVSFHVQQPPKRSSYLSFQKLYHGRQPCVVVVSAVSGGDSGGESSVDTSTGVDASFSAADTVIMDAVDTGSATSLDSLDTSSPGMENQDEPAGHHFSNDLEVQSDEPLLSESRTVQPFFATPVDTQMGLENNETMVERAKQGVMSRRAAFQYGGVLLAGSVFTTVVSQKTSHLPDQKSAKPKTPSLIPQPVLKRQQQAPSKASSSSQTVNTSNTPPSVGKQQATKSGAMSTAKPQDKKTRSLNSATIGRLEPINLAQVASETNINVTMTCNEGCISVDSKNFTKVQRAKLPSWLPSWLKSAQPPKVIKQISDPELLVASTVAGASMEMFRTGLLYPVSTVKVRVQQERHNFTRRAPPLSEKVVTLGSNIQEKVQEGNLYAGSKLDAFPRC